MQVAGLASTYTPETAALAPLRRWVPPAVVIVVAALWLTMALVLVRVGWGMRRARPSGQEEAPLGDAEGSRASSWGDVWLIIAASAQPLP